MQIDADGKPQASGTPITLDLHLDDPTKKGRMAIAVRRKKGIAFIVFLGV